MPFFRPKQRRRVTVGVQLGTLTLVGNSSLVLTGTRIAGGAPGSAALKFGSYAGQTDFMGAGPGGDFTGSAYRLCGTNPHQQTVAEIQADLAAAAAQNIVLFWTTCDSPASFGASSAAGFSQANYRQNLLDLDAKTPLIGQAIRGEIAGVRVVCVAGDEPQHAKWSITPPGTGASTWTPTLVNQCCRDHKKLWPGATTAIRTDANRLRFGWDGLPVPVSGYDGLDYCMTQYEGPDLQASRTFAQMIANDRPHAAAINVDVIPTINLWSCGVQTVAVNGVPACWDMAFTGSSNGVIAGTVNGALPSGSGLTDGQQVACATWAANPNKQTAAGSPAQIRSIATQAALDPAIPWLPFWAYPQLGALGLSWAVPLHQRSDIVSALDDAIAICAARATANPLRAIKPVLVGWPAWP